jgi:hypothetical protein
MAIDFQSEEEVLRNLRERLRKMTDEELIRFGKAVRRLAENPFSAAVGRGESGVEEAEGIGKMAVSKFDAGLHYFFPPRLSAGFCSRSLKP